MTIASIQKRVFGIHWMGELRQAGHCGRTFPAPSVSGIVAAPGKMGGEEGKLRISE
jgi:hypothetical protein